MAGKYIFESLEELSSAFPIHSIFSERKLIYISAVHNDEDYRENIPDELKTYTISFKKIAKNKYLETKIFKDIIFVDGYIYDGKYWYPAQRQLDKMKRLNEHDIFKEEDIVIYEEGMEHFMYRGYEPQCANSKE